MNTKVIIVVVLICSGAFCQVPMNVFRILVAYTPAAQQDWINANRLITDGIRIGVANANSFYQNSQISVRIELAGTMLVNYVESPSSSQDHSNFMNPSHPVLGFVHDVKDEYAADIAVLVSQQNDGWGGWASVTVSESQSYIWVRNGSIEEGQALAHEIGHNFGAGHDRAHPVGAAFSYGNGICVEVPGKNGWRTVQAYNNGNCNDKAPIFTNPLITYAPPGYTPITLGSTTYEDVARVHEERDAAIVAFRNTLSNFALPGDNILIDEFAHFLATNSVTIPAGLTIQGELAISVGSQVMQKRGVEENTILVSDDKEIDSLPGIAQFDTRFEYGNGQLTVSLALDKENQVTSAIYDIKGKLQLQKEVRMTSGPNTYRMDLRLLKQGEYYLKLVVGKHKIYKKITKI